MILKLKNNLNTTIELFTKIKFLKGLKVLEL